MKTSIDSSYEGERERNLSRVMTCQTKGDKKHDTKV